MEPRTWDAHWIAPASSPLEDLGVFAFRCQVIIPKLPEQFIVRVSADQRYKLYANQAIVGFGPQRGDLRHWFYETYDLAPHLGPGENWITALVWNFGRWAPMAQITARTAFVVEGDNLCTPGSWEVARVADWTFDMMHAGVGEFYIDVGPGERIAPVPLPNTPWASRLTWRAPHIICQAEERACAGGGTPWMLMPRTLPPMRYQRRGKPPTVRRGFAGDGAEFGPPDGTPLEGSLHLEPGMPLLLDYGELLTAYPRLTLSTESEANVRVTYDEALWNPDGTKGDRDNVDGKLNRGYQDRIVPGSQACAFEPLWWRTFRYLKLETDGRATLHTCDAIETGYPLDVESSFTASDPWVGRIWETSVRTARRCAGETYFDCPYYEQLQYVGDTRIQALIGYYLSRDRRLQSNAVETLGWSLMPEGLTQSRYPSRQVQIIPPFSLFWVLMVADQLLYDKWPDKQRIEQAIAVLRAWAGQRFDDQYWRFYDWVPGWRAGEPPEGAELTKLLLALAHLVPLANFAEATEATDRDWKRRTRASRRLLREFERARSRFLKGDSWPLRTKSRGSPGDRLSESDPRRFVPTEHGEALYRLVQRQLGLPVAPWSTEFLDRHHAARCTYYFSYYKHLAMFALPEHEPHGPQELTAEPVTSDSPYPFDYLTELQPWKEMIESGLSTFAETPEPTRSDCHAWSAHPILGFFQIVAGVTSAAPGWAQATIMPHPGSLRRFDARIAHPEGELRVAYENEKLAVASPVPFHLDWRGRSQTFPAGRFNE